MTKDKLFRKEYARVLLAIARGDLESAMILAEHQSKGRKENICFSAQQCIEKALNAVVCARGKPVPLTHSIELILDRLGKTLQPPNEDGLIELTDFATAKRYQEGNEIISKEDIAATISAAQATFSWAEDSVTELLKTS